MVLQDVQWGTWSASLLSSVLMSSSKVAGDLGRSTGKMRITELVETGKVTTLRVARVEDDTVFLDGGGGGEIRLRRGKDLRFFSPGQELEVFVFIDDSDARVATTTLPRAQAGQFAWLKVVSVTSVGAFLEWGLVKDLLVPYREQQHPMEAGRSYLVHIYAAARGGRLVASSRLERFISDGRPPFEPGQAVELLIAGPTDLGYKAIVEHTHWGLLYRNEGAEQLGAGQKVNGFIKQVRPDGKIDLSLHRPGDLPIGDFAGEVLAALQEAGGFLALTDKSPPRAIRDRFGVSKKVFKKTLGNLYRRRLVALEQDGIRLVADKKSTADSGQGEG